MKGDPMMMKGDPMMMKGKGDPMMMKGDKGKGKGKGKKGRGGKAKSGKPLKVSTTGNKVAGGAAFFISLLWFGLVCATCNSGWHFKMSHIWNFYVGLYRLEINMESAGGLALRLVAKGIDKASETASGKESSFMRSMMTMFSKGEHTIQNIRDQMCNAELFAGALLGNMCDVWKKMMWASWLMTFAIFFVVFFLMTAGSMCFLETTRCGRIATYGLFGASFIFAAGGVAGYWVLTIDFEAWLVSQNLAVSLGTTADKGLFASMLLALISPLPAMLLACCGSKMPPRQKKQLSDSGSGSDFGGNNFGPPPPGYYDKGGFDKGDPGKGFDPMMKGDPGKGPPMGDFGKGFKG